MDTCGICQKPAVQLFETGKDGVYACFKCQPLVPEITLEDNSSDNSQAQTAPEQGSADSGYYCGLCHKTFQKNMQLQNHLRNHRAERRFVCTYCNKAFSQSNNLRAHLRIHTNERPFKCNECGKAFTQVTNLNNHVRLHTGERPFVCPEPGCDKAYAQVTNLNQHRKRHLSGRPIEQSYECNVCGEQFAQRNHMTNHRRVAHGEVSKSPGRPARRACPACDLSFPNDRLLQLHTSDAHGDHAHSDKTEFACVFSTCGMRFPTPREHTEHLLRAHQLRVLATSAGDPPRRGRPPKQQDKPDEAYVENLKRALLANYTAVEVRSPKSHNRQQVNGSRRSNKPIEVSSDEEMAEEYLEEEQEAGEQEEAQEEVQEEMPEEIQEEYLETVMEDPLEIKQSEYEEVSLMKQPQYMPKLKVQSLFQ